jgi:hypothetical protein
MLVMTSARREDDAIARGVVDRKPVIKRYLVARFRGQVTPLLSVATDSDSKRSSPGGSH